MFTLKTLFVSIFVGAYAYTSFDQLPGTYIIGGIPVNITSYPYQLSLMYWRSHICGAVIISKNWAITTAFCIQGREEISLTVRSASSSISHGGKIHQVIQVIKHPSYASWLLDYDFALIKVHEPFELGKPGVEAIKITNEEPNPGTATTVSGWGAVTATGEIVDELHAVNVSIIDRTKCYEEFTIVKASMICAAATGKGSCNGDRGGPLVNNENGELVGLVSWGAGCANPKYPGVYSNIAKATDWIKQTIGL